MANDVDVMEMLKALSAKGVNLADIMKGLKGAKEAGIIKSSGRGKSPESDPLRVAVRNTFVGLKLSYKDGDKEVKDVSILDAVKAAIGDGISFMVTLNDDFKINIIKNIPHEKKEKAAKKEEQKKDGPADFAEPVIA